MLKNIMALEIKVGENIHQYNMPSQCGVGEILDVLTQFRAYALNIYIEEQKKSEQQMQEVKEKASEPSGE